MSSKGVLGSFSSHESVCQSGQDPACLALSKQLETYRGVRPEGLDHVMNYAQVTAKLQAVFYHVWVVSTTESFQTAKQLLAEVTACIKRCTGDRYIAQRIGTMGVPGELMRTLSGLTLSELDRIKEQIHYRLVDNKRGAAPNPAQQEKLRKLCLRALDSLIMS